MISIGGILIGFLYVLLYCALIILVAFTIRWALTFVGVGLEGSVEKWGRIVVALLCAIVIVTWLVSVVGGAPFPPTRLRW